MRIEKPCSCKAVSYPSLYCSQRPAFIVETSQSRKNEGGLQTVSELCFGLLFLLVGFLCPSSQIKQATPFLKERCAKELLTYKALKNCSSHLHPCIDITPMSVCFLKRKVRQKSRSKVFALLFSKSNRRSNARSVGRSSQRAKSLTPPCRLP